MRILVAVLLMCVNAQAADVTSTRVSAYDFQAQDAAGNKLTDHTRFDTALIACLNNPACVFVAGGKYRITRAGATPPVIPPVVTPPVTGTALLTWSAPTLNTDGTAVKTPVSYKVYHGRASDVLSESIPVAGMAYNFTGLPAGTHYFAVSAVTADGESALSGVGSKVIQ